MKSITLDLPDEIAGVFESLPSERKAIALLIAAALAKTNKTSPTIVFEEIDKRILELGLSNEDIDSLLEDLS